MGLLENALYGQIWKSEKRGTYLIDLRNLGEYDIILADPPWKYDSPGAINVVRKDTVIIENHYDTMSLEDIKNMRIPAAKDSMLFLWATSPLLPEALEVMNAWGFTYKSNAIWHKSFGYYNGQICGTRLGFYFMNSHELILVGKRGSIKCPSPGNRYNSVFEGKTKAHSQKPDIVYSIIEKMYPCASKIELFARRRREGWAVWGNQVENQIQTTLIKEKVLV
jgi:N6-adenosine-specific RNA methylase IME4